VTILSRAKTDRVLGQNFEPPKLNWERREIKLEADFGAGRPSLCRVGNSEKNNEKRKKMSKIAHFLPGTARWRRVGLVKNG